MRNLPFLHLKMNKLEEGKLIDSSGNGFHGLTKGESTIIADETFGACLEVKDPNFQISMEKISSRLATSSLSFSFWVRGKCTGHLVTNEGQKILETELQQAEEEWHHLALTADKNTRKSSYYLPFRTFRDILNLEI